MKLKDMLARGRALEGKHGGDIEVLMRDAGSTDALSVVRLETLQLVTATILELGNGAAGMTLDDEQPGTQVPGILLD